MRRRQRAAEHGSLPLSRRAARLRLASRRPRLANRFGGQDQAPSFGVSVTPDRVQRRIQVVPHSVKRFRVVGMGSECLSTFLIVIRDRRSLRLQCFVSGRSNPVLPEWHSTFYFDRSRILRPTHPQSARGTRISAFVCPLPRLMTTDGASRPAFSQAEEAFAAGVPSRVRGPFCRRA
jgi:hypothetical protein